MLNVKKALTKILGVFAKPLGDVETETFPFTATKSGVCCVVVVPPTSAVSYLYVTENGGVHARGYTTGGITYTLSFPVVKGKTYALSNSANYSITNGVRIYPILGGGYSVVSSLLSRLAERRWEYAEHEKDTHEDHLNNWSGLLCNAFIHVREFIQYYRKAIHQNWNICSNVVKRELHQVQSRSGKCPGKCRIGETYGNNAGWWNKCNIGNNRFTSYFNKGTKLTISERGWSCA